MLNWIWLGLVVGAVFAAGLNGKLAELPTAAFDAAKNAVMNLALPLAGLMALWLGMMRLAERAGLVAALARLLQPLLRRLFPDVPAGHPALGSMVMNIAANMLGLSNAATPLGLRAMRDLETLNPHPGIATNAMCTFLAINTSSVQIIPATAVAVLAASGSAQPTAIIGTALVATCCSTIAGLVSVKLLEKLPAYRLPTPADVRPELGEASAAKGQRDVQSMVCQSAIAQSAVGQSAVGPSAIPQLADGQSPVGQSAISSGSNASQPAAVFPPLPFFAKVTFGVVLLAFAGLAIRLVFFPAGAVEPRPITFSSFLETISLLAIPFVFTFFPLAAAVRGVAVYEEFVEGAREGFEVAVKIIPYLVAILAAVGMFRAAGGIDAITGAVGGVFAAVGVPVELLPLILVRPLSGSGALGLFTELAKTHGPDSLLARMGATILGSTETTFYVIAVYFGSVGIRRTRHAVPAGLIADAAGMIAAIAICRLVFA